MPKVKPKVNHNISIGSADLIFCNFSGKPTAVNKAGGVREFGVVLDPELAEDLASEGWRVKSYLSKHAEEGDSPTLYLPVSIRFDVYPPNIWFITSRNRTRLTENTVGMLDGMLGDISNVDIVIRPHNWGPNARGESGVKAYVKNMYITIEEDEFFDKYADIPDSSEDVPPFDED